MGVPPAGPLARRGALLAMLALACCDVQAGIYRCTANGRTTFRDKPCDASEKQSVISQDNSRFAGCFGVDDSLAWEGGGGSWVLRVDHTDAGYVLRDFTAKGSGKLQAANVPMHRATPDELDRASQLLRFRTTSGVVAELPERGGTPNGLFHIWDADGNVRLVAAMPFVNGFAVRGACP
jgi:hypothetical protein